MRLLNVYLVSLFSLLFFVLFSVSVYAEEVEFVNDLATSSDYMVGATPAEIVTGLAVMVFATAFLAGISLVGDFLTRL